MNINPLLKYQRRLRRAARTAANRHVLRGPDDKVPPPLWYNAGPGPQTCGIPPFPERRSYLCSRRDARRRRNARLQGGAR